MAIPVLFRRLSLCRDVSQLVSRRSGRGSAGILAVMWRAASAAPVDNPLFVICEARTGSTLLCDCLNSHPMVCSAFEILNQGQIFALRFARSPEDIHYYLDTLWKAMPGHLRSGKIHCSHFDELGIGPRDLGRWFPRARFLVLYRVSLLDQFVSLKLAQTTGRWIATCPGDETRHSITIDLDELSEFAVTTSRRYTEIVHHPALGGRHKIISYESLVADTQGVFNDTIWPFVGIPPVTVTTMLRKQNRLSLETCVTNLKEVRYAVYSGRISASLESFDPEHA
jgi:LPS sulfotransferase NodH